MSLPYGKTTKGLSINAVFQSAGARHYYLTDWRFWSKLSSILFPLLAASIFSLYALGPLLCSRGTHSHTRFQASSIHTASQLATIPQKSCSGRGGSGGAGRRSGPSGIYSLLPGDRLDKPLGPLAQATDWNNPVISGVSVRTFWNKVEPEQGKFDWTLFDQAVDLAKASGKKVGLALGAGFRSPSWIYSNAGAKRFSFTLGGPMREASSETMPMSWDPGFQRAWGDTVKAMGNRYDGKPEVAYIVITGIGFGFESYFARKPEDIAHFQQEGGAPKWLEGAERVIDLYADAFPTTPFLIGLGPPTFSPEGQAAMEALADYGLKKYPGRFGLMHGGLNARSRRDFPPNALIEANSTRAPVGFQMVWSTQGQNASQIKGTLDEALQRAIELKAHFVEVYSEDCSTAQYQAFLKNAAAALEKNQASFSLSLSPWPTRNAQASGETRFKSSHTVTTSKTAPDNADEIRPDRWNPPRHDRQAPMPASTATVRFE